MNQIEKWASRHPPGIACFALWLAMTAREQCKALQRIKERQLYDHKFPLPDLPKWFAFYRSSKTVLRAYTRFLTCGNNKSNIEDIAILQFFREFQKLIKKAPDGKLYLTVTPEELKEGVEFWMEQLESILAEIREEIAGILASPEEKKVIRDQFEKDELPLGFYFLVYAPSKLFYNITPQTLYKRALNNDMDALEKLLKLDPLIIHDHAIGQVFQATRLYGKRNVYEKLHAAINKYPCTAHSNLRAARKSVKSLYGGHLACLAKVYNYKFPAAEIRYLYDALARSFGENQDQDIGSPEGFDKTVKTKMLQWQKQYQETENKK